MTRFHPGERVFLPGSSGEPTGVLDALFASEGAEVITTFLPGVNRVPPREGRGANVTGLFAHPGAVTPWPITYDGLARWMERPQAIDTAVVQVSPPDKHGDVTFGPSVEFGLRALACAARRIAVVNPQVASSLASPKLPLSAFTEVVEHAAALRTYGAGEPDADARAIAAHLASFIEDGAALQFGIGKVPSALAGALHDRRGLRLRSGLLSEGVRGLAQAGALAPGCVHIGAILLGSDDFYAWAADQDVFRLVGCETTHDAARLANLDGLIAMNSALEVDLFGQCNLEAAGGAQVSGCGGAPDFARGARLSKGGLSVIALPSSFAGGSRITPRLSEPGLATLPRHDVDLVVTEHGAADLRNLSTPARAEALIAVAGPAYRGALADAWREIAGRLRF